MEKELKVRVSIAPGRVAQLLVEILGEYSDVLENISIQQVLLIADQIADLAVIEFDCDQELLKALKNGGHWSELQELALNAESFVKNFSKCSKKQYRLSNLSGNLEELKEKYPGIL